MKTFKFSFVFAAVAVFAGGLTSAQSPSKSSVSKYDSELAKRLGGDKYGMKKFVLAILKTGPNDASVTGKERADVFKGHIANIQRLAGEGKLAVAGPLGENTNGFRGIFVFNVATVEEAKTFTETDPVVKAGVMTVDYFPWYASAALTEVNKIHEKIALETH